MLAIIIIIVIALLTIMGKPKADEAYEEYKANCEAANKEVTYKPNNWLVSLIIAILTVIILVVLIGTIGSTGVLPLPEN
jgi:uncharacterized membrane protein